MNKLSIDRRFTEEVYKLSINSDGSDAKEIETLIQMVEYIKPYRRRNILVSQLKHIKAEFKKPYALILDAYKQVKPLATKDPT
ncbi:hypothetical protein NHB34_01810 [Polynucleobacter sp. MWH-UH19D]|uniref:hypothetical protein n=1 Tax=Polynucleobacter sp. MWH-UH19D TaxID=1855610 RepID=UPI003364E536